MITFVWWSGQSGLRKKSPRWTSLLRQFWYAQQPFLMVTPIPWGSSSYFHFIDEATELGETVRRPKRTMKAFCLGAGTQWMGKEGTRGEGVLRKIRRVTGGTREWRIPVIKGVGQQRTARERSKTSSKVLIWTVPLGEHRKATWSCLRETTQQIRRQVGGGLRGNPSATGLAMRLISLHTLFMFICLAGSRTTK